MPKGIKNFVENNKMKVQTSHVLNMHKIDSLKVRNARTSNHSISANKLEFSQKGDKQTIDIGKDTI